MIVRSTIIIVVVLRSKTKEAQSWLRYAQQLYPFGISWFSLGKQLSPEGRSWKIIIYILLFF